MASAILDSMQGTLGSAAWRYVRTSISRSSRLLISFIRWLFYIEGTLTVLVAILAMFILPDFPANSGSWLTPLEIRLAELRMKESAGVTSALKGDGESDNQFEGFILAMSDWKVWWLGVLLASLITSLSFNVFFPTLSATMGYSRTVTLLLCAPPWIFATVVAYFVARYYIHPDA